MGGAPAGGARSLGIPAPSPAILGPAGTDRLQASLVVRSHPSDAGGDPAWIGYLDAFHGERAGITEQLLRRCRSGDGDPYNWCAGPLRCVSGPILDMGCGSGPMAARLPGWIGIDRSTAELAVARREGRSPLVRADAASLPVGTVHVAGAVLAMTLQILAPFEQVLAEVARVARPGATVVVLVPGRRPLPLRDALLYLRLQRRLQQRIGYPNDRQLAGRGFRRMLPAAGFEVVDDARRAFRFPLADADDAELFISSLYLPGVDERRLAGGLELIRRRVGAEISVPLRRVVLRRSGGDA